MTAIPWILLGLVVIAAGPEPKSVSEPGAFFQDFVAAARNGGIDGIRRLTHPASLACIEPDHESHYRQLMTRQIQMSVTAASDIKVTIEQISAVEFAESQQALTEFGLFWPTAPSMRIVISVRSSGSSADGAPRGGTLTHDLPIALTDGEWRWVFPCLRIETEEHSTQRPV